MRRNTLILTLAGAAADAENSLTQSRFAAYGQVNWQSLAVVVGRSPLRWRYAGTTRWWARSARSSATGPAQLHPGGAEQNHPDQQHPVIQPPVLGDMTGCRAGR